MEVHRPPELSPILIEEPADAPMDPNAIMEERRKVWLKSYKTYLDLNDVLEIRNPQAVIEFVPEII